MRGGSAAHPFVHTLCGHNPSDITSVRSGGRATIGSRHKPLLLYEVKDTVDSISPTHHLCILHELLDLLNFILSYMQLKRELWSGQREKREEGYCGGIHPCTLTS